MWVQIVCGVVFYKLLRRVLFDDDAIPDVDTSGSDASFAVAKRLERLYGGKTFVGLRIPDPETGSRQHIDVVLVTKKEVMVVVVRNFSGSLKVAKDGSWACTSDNKQKSETHPDLMLEISRQVGILQSYLEQRGVPLLKGHVIGRIVLPNPNCRPAYSIALQPEVISFDKWRELKPEWKGGVSNWIKDAFHRSKSEMQDGSSQKLSFILSTSPMWDRLQLNGGRNILGRSRILLLYSHRDYRSEGASASEWNDVAVKPNTEFLFQPFNSKKPLKFKLSSAASLTFSV